MWSAWKCLSYGYYVATFHEMRVSYRVAFDPTGENFLMFIVVRPVVSVLAPPIQLSAQSPAHTTIECVERAVEEWYAERCARRLQGLL